MIKQNINIGDVIFCKKDISNFGDVIKIRFCKNKYYEIFNICNYSNKKNDYDYYIKDETGYVFRFNHGSIFFNRHFYTKNKYRLLKLKKINND